MEQLEESMPIVTSIIGSDDLTFPGFFDLTMILSIALHSSTNAKTNSLVNGIKNQVSAPSTKYFSLKQLLNIECNCVRILSALIISNIVIPPLKAGIRHRTLHNIPDYVLVSRIFANKKRKTRKEEERNEWFMNTHTFYFQFNELNAFCIPSSCLKMFMRWVNGVASAKNIFNCERIQHAKNQLYFAILFQLQFMRKSLDSNAKDRQSTD